MDQSFETEHAVAIECVREAARLCRSVAREISPEVMAKKDKSPVTVADFGSQALVCRALAEGRVVVAALACPNLPATTGIFDKDDANSGGSIFHAASGQGAFVVTDEWPSGHEPRPLAVAVSRRSQPAELRICESVEAGHSAQGDAAAVAARTGITAPPIRMDSQAKYAVVARGEADIYLRLPTRADYRDKI
jgi:3'-phosphoadenosine 5'-phosphosulfate (PAPS) 3'-phosphatase